MEPLEELAARAAAGDRLALDALCRRIAGPIYRIAVRMLGHPGDAEDAAQEVLVLVVTHLAQYEGRSAFMTWVYTIAARQLLRTRRRRAEERVSDAAQVAAMIDAGLLVAAPGAQPQGDALLLEKEIRMACAQAMLLALSREERLAVVLADLLGADDQLGAEIAETTPGAFRQRLARGRAKLRPILEERCGVMDAANPCRCARQAVAKQTLGLPETLRFARHPEEADPRLARAHDQLGALVRGGRLFAVDAPLLPSPMLLERLLASFPELLA